MIKIKVYKNRLEVSHRELLTEGNVNSLFVEFEFSSEWDGLSKIAVFENGENRVYMSIENGSCAIPWEVLQSCGKLRVSIRGVNNTGNEVLCTEDADLGYVHNSLASQTSAESHEPTEDRFAELENMIRGISLELQNPDSEACVYENAFKIGISNADNVYTSDKSFAEIAEAYQNGKFVYVDFDGAFFYLDVFIAETRFVFNRTFIDNDTVKQILFRIDSDDSVTRTDDEYENALFVEVDSSGSSYSVESGTFENIAFAYSNNRPVFAKADGYVFLLIHADTTDAVFSVTVWASGRLATATLTIAANDTVTVTQNEMSGGGAANAVLYTSQTLTDAQKAQARENIGAGNGNVVYVNVKDYGALGDGTTDDTDAIADAVEDVPVGGVLYFPVGVYRVSNIELKSDMTLLGCGYASVIKLLDDTEDFYNNCLSLINVNNVTVSAIKLDGNRSNNASTGASQDQRLNGIYINSCENISVNKVWMYNNGYHGSLFMSSNNIVFDSCKCTDNGFRPIHGHTAISNIRITDCYCDHNGLGLTGGSGHLYDAIFVFGVNGCTIKGNTVKSNRAGCIAVSGKSSQNDSTNGVSIVGNTCECYLDGEGNYVPPTDTQLGAIGIDVESAYCSNVTITGNTVLNAWQGIYVYDHTKGHIISGNNIERCNYGIHVKQSTDVAISGNIFRNMGTQAVRMDETARISVVGNTVIEDDENPVSAAQRTAVHIYATDECFIADNAVYANSHYNYGFRIYGSASVPSTNNVIKGNRIEAVNTGIILNESAEDNLVYLNVHNGELINGDFKVQSI